MFRTALAIKNPLEWMTSTWCRKIRPSTVDTYSIRRDRDRNGEYAHRRDHTRKRKLKTKNIVPRGKYTRTIAARSDTTGEELVTSSTDDILGSLFENQI